MTEGDTPGEEVHHFDVEDHENECIQVVARAKLNVGGANSFDTALVRLELDPVGALRFVMEDRGLKPADLASVLGSRAKAYEILSGKRSISKEQAKRLGQFFRVSPAVFI